MTVTRGMGQELSPYHPVGERTVGIQKEGPSPAMLKKEEFRHNRDLLLRPFLFQHRPFVHRLQSGVWAEDRGE